MAPSSDGMGGWAMAVSVPVVGTGQRGMGLAELLARSPKFRLTALCDVDEGWLAAAVECFGVGGSGTTGSWLSAATSRRWW
jgi:predicted dehydrogenase